MEEMEKQSSRVWLWLYRLRSVFLGVPVLVAALILALRNMIKLPDSVTFSSAALNDVGNLIFQNITISKGLAVWGPFAITVICVGMIVLSRRVVYPFVISLFTLAVPIVLNWVNIFQ